MPTDLLDKYRRSLTEAQQTLRNRLEPSRVEFITQLETEMHSRVLKFLDEMKTFVTEKTVQYLLDTGNATIKYIQDTQEPEQEFHLSFEHRIKHFWGVGNSTETQKSEEIEKPTESQTIETAIHLSAKETEQIVSAIRDAEHDKFMGDIHSSVNELNTIGEDTTSN